MIPSHKLSIAEQLALLTDEERRAVFEGMSEQELEELEYSWEFWGRPAQFAPGGAWNIWLILAGRGFGKSRAGAEWVRQKAMNHPGCRIALVGRTSSDVQKVMIYGDSGILAVHPEADRPEHKISKSRIEWPNGSVAETFTAEEADQLRGPQFHYAWADEFAAWKFDKDASGLNAFDNLRIAVRLGEHPQICATTTPRRTEAMIELLDESVAKPGKVVITRGSTYDNAANMAADYFETLTGRYEGTNIEQQELLGLMLDDKEGALWRPDLIDTFRFVGDPAALRQLPLRVVAVDPSVAENPRDECGIVVIGSTRQRHLHQRHAYVLEDASLRASTDVWAARAVEMAHKWSAPILAEGTQGQQLIVNTIKSIDPTVHVLLVQTGRQGKKARAEPVILPYEQGRVHHIPGLDELELQLTTWDPEISKKSPDRLDALVHGITALLIRPPKGLFSGGLRSSGPTDRRLPTDRGTGRSRAPSSVRQSAPTRGATIRGQV